MGRSIRLYIRIARDKAAQWRDIAMPIILLLTLAAGAAVGYIVLTTQPSTHAPGVSIPDAPNSPTKLSNPLPSQYKWGRGFKGTFGGPSGHNGVDIAAPQGTVIYAAGDGVVEKVSNQETSCGIYLRIKHTEPSGLRTTYCHCSKILVMSGAKVSRGQPVALVGSTGRSTGPHLHFVVRKDGFTSVDPRNHTAGFTNRQRR